MIKIEGSRGVSSPCGARVQPVPWRPLVEAGSKWNTNSYNFQTEIRVQMVSERKNFFFGWKGLHQE